MKSAHPPSPDPALPLCDVLEQEYAEIFHAEVPPGPSGWFTPDDILDPERLAERLLLGTDRAAQGLGQAELADTLTELGPFYVRKMWAEVRQVLAVGLNRLLWSPGLYDRARNTTERFEGVRFRSQTLDQIARGYSVERNRLILEDTFFELSKIYDQQLQALYRKIHQKRPSALCFSGGGIRSATFGLGVAQGLARAGLLNHFNYLSTVSGGGYLGGWLSAWIQRAGLPNVIKQLGQPSGRPMEPDPTPVWHLRTYSNYLSPRLGLFAADTWTLIATYFRNLTLGWLVLVPALVAALSTPLVVLAVIRWNAAAERVQWQTWICWILGLSGFVCGILAVRYVHDNRPVSRFRTEGTGLVDRKKNQRDFLTFCLGPLCIAAAAAAICWAWIARGVQVGVPIELITFVIIGVSVHMVGWLFAGHPRADGEKRLPYLGRLGLELAFIAAAGAGAGAVLWNVAAWVAPAVRGSALGPALYTWLAVPFLLALILVFNDLYVGYASRGQVDAAREWSARFNAWALIVIMAWFGIAGLVIMGPIVLDALAERFAPHPADAIKVGKAIGVAIGAVSGVVTALQGRSAKTAGSTASRADPMTLPLMIAAPTFVLFLIVFASWAGSACIRAVAHVSLLARPTSAPVSAPAIGWAVLTLILLLAFSIVTARFIDMNRFSLHGMYRARLIRAYLGASRPAGERDPNPFTGFDDQDNISMRALWPDPGSPKVGYDGRPFHLVNVALNLVGGGNLAWQERKAESFTFSPLHCGAHNHGYRPTQSSLVPPGTPLGAGCPGYGGPGGPTLGTAITISGAAVSPNMGYHSSPVISLLLALFNVRLGAWLGNPGYAGNDVYLRRAPQSSLKLSVDELFGRTDAKHPYVYLSDGGHFENLGLYEMVLRRCHTIVLSDGGSDPQATFENLGNAVRKIRIDFGIPIEFTSMDINARVDGKPAEAGGYCAVGTIGYSCVDEGADDGTLIYIKPAFYGNEPKDIYNYALAHPAFPHEGTGDQFYSESQFESYRALGSYVIDQIVPEPQPASDPFAIPSIAWLVRQADAYVRSLSAPPRPTPGSPAK